MEPSPRPAPRTLAGCLCVLSILLPAMAGAATSPDHGNAVGAERYQYLSPRPGADYVSRWNNVAIRLGPAIDAASLNAGAISVTGTQSGVHEGTLVLSDDTKTVVFRPDQPFDLGETVVVRLDGGIATRDGHALPPFTYAFHVSKADPKLQRHPELDELLRTPPAFGERPLPSPEAARTPQLETQACEALPVNYIPTTLLQSDDPYPGGVFLAPFTQINASPHGRLLILDNQNMPLFFRDLPIRTFDFKRQNNGLLTFFIQPGAAFLAMDSTYTVVDTFRTGNGYETDVHELLILPNGHSLMMAYDWEPVDMSVIAPGGNPNASVAGLIVQELDASKNVVFQWRSWDHFQITDMIECGRSFSDSLVDWVHGNAIEPDQDGNLLISSRHLNEITKIDRATGNTIWRLGLNAKNNDFTFVGDAHGFSHQHDIRRLPNGHITLFNNGNCLSPLYSSAMEYELDETNKIATLVWEHRETPDVYCFAMGNVQRHDDGGTLIGWGANPTNPNVTELHANGSKAWEIGFSEPTTWSYRAFRFPWQTTKFATAEDSLDFGTVHTLGQGDLPLTVENPGATDLDITCFVSSDPSFWVTDPVPVTVPAGGSTVVNVRFSPPSNGPHEATLYVRAANDTELVARPVDVRGTGVATLPAVPPTGLVLLGAGLLGAAAWAMRRRRWSPGVTD